MTAISLWQPAIPDEYTRASDEALAERIERRRAELGDDLIILGHHYQQDDVIRFADFTGDSFKLSQLAAERVAASGASTVVFCGVHFMAESADILTDDGVRVLLPDLGAGCSMADMANHDQCVDAWEQLEEALAGTDTRVVPVCYMNSSAAIKAFCGEHGGAVCTSSNADKVLRWALAGGAEPLRDGEQAKVLFIPDQHLGRNTAAGLGMTPDVDGEATPDMCVWDPRTPDALGGNSEAMIRHATMLLWKGHCSVHKLFRPEHIDEARQRAAEAGHAVTVVVHPECAYEVCQQADVVGSTEVIRVALEEAEPGTHWVIGTEVHMVDRLCRQAAERGVHARILSDCQCLCTTMYRIDPPHLAWVLDRLADGEAVNQITVDPAVKHWSLVAPDRMLDITAAR